jgi:hypothetical protein
MRMEIGPEGFIVECIICMLIILGMSFCAYRLNLGLNSFRQVDKECTGENNEFKTH